MSGQWDERSQLADFQKKFFAPEKRQRKKCFFLSFYTLSYLDVLGYCVSLLNIVRIKAPLLEQKDRIWVIDGILGQQSFNIVTCNNKFSNYLRQFELSFYFFQTASLTNELPLSPSFYIILYVPHFQLPLAEHLSFLQIPSLLESQRDTVHYVSLEPGLDTEEGSRHMNKWLFTSQSFQKVLKFLLILLYIIIQ